MRPKLIIRIVLAGVLSLVGSVLLFRSLAGDAAATAPAKIGGAHKLAAPPQSAALRPAALTISNLQTVNITPFSAIVAWQTDFPADSRVEFWTDGDTVTKSVSQPARAQMHELLLSGLAGNTLYHYRVTSETGDGQTATSTEQSFTTTISRIMFDENGGFLVDDQPFFPIMQWLQCAHRIEYQSTLGINTFMGMGCSGDTSQSFLDTCQTNAVWGIVPFNATVKDHPSLLGWFWEDEPEMPRSGSAPSLYPLELRAIYDTIREEDQAHPFLTTFTSRFAERFGGYDWMGEETEEYFDYVNATDVPGFDHYPVYGWCRPDWLHEISDFQDEFMGYTGWRPTYQWIEAARTTSKYCELSERGEDDGPYPEEIRNEVWQAIVHGAKAIGYFTHSWECPGYTQFCMSPEQIAEMTRTNQQITALAPAILGLDRSQAVGGQAAGGGRADVTAREYDGDLYIFAVSLERSAQTVTFAVTGLSSATVEVIDESRNVALQGGQFVDDFDELGVHLYKIPNSPHAPEVTLHGTPANRAIHLTWDVNGTLPATSTWTINYASPGSAFLPITGLTNTLHAHTLTGLTNYVLYTVTLSAVADGSVLVSDTITAMPTDRFVYLPLILR
ncbi:MAG: fibronectin type III domain-containing protein [Anaerolineae bacterium]|nr:fibronectin type III domain-containing protein [Anaerolineae bacterium]